MSKAPPAFRLLTKNEGDEGLTEIGQVWKTSKADVFSVVLDLEGTGERISFMMMPNKPKPQAASNNTQRGNGRTAAASGPRPA
jgi:hypothetical protein